MSTGQPGGGPMEHKGSQMGLSWSNASGFLREMVSRPDAREIGLVVQSQADRVWRPPIWLDKKNVTVLGKTIEEEDRHEEHFENKFAHELAIGAARLQAKDREECDEIIGKEFAVPMRWFLNNVLGVAERSETSQQAMKRGSKEFLERQEIAIQEKKQRDLSWEGFITALEDDRPFIYHVRQARNTYDVYGVDDWLDCAIAVLWASFKCGAIVGVTAGGYRAMKVVTVDAMFFKATGLGTLSFVTASTLSSFIKWSGNLTVLSAAWLAGDRITSLAKTLTLPEGVVPTRTPINYGVGFSCAMSTVGIMPLYFLQDTALTFRLTVSFGIVGFVTGYALGLLTQRFIAGNLQQLDYTPGEFRTYMALMKRETAFAQDKIGGLQQKTIQETMKAYN